MHIKSAITKVWIAKKGENRMKKLGDVVSKIMLIALVACFVSSCGGSDYSSSKQISQNKSGVKEADKVQKEKELVFRTNCFEIRFPHYYTSSYNSQHSKYHFSVYDENNPGYECPWFEIYFKGLTKYLSSGNFGKDTVGDFKDNDAFDGTTYTNVKLGNANAIRASWLSYDGDEQSIYLIPMKDWYIKIQVPSKRQNLNSQINNILQSIKLYSTECQPSDDIHSVTRE